MKEKIVEVSLERFLQYGIRSMTIKKLVEPMGMSTKTVYKYFRSKEELLEACLLVLYTAYYNESEAILSKGNNPVTALLTLLRATMAKDFGVNHAFFHDLNYYYPDLQNAAIGRTSDNYRNVMIPLVQSGIAEGYFHSFIRAEVALKGIFTLYTSITRSEDYKNYLGSVNDLFRNLVEVYLRGMCTEKGILEIENQAI